MAKGSFYGDSSFYEQIAQASADVDAAVAAAEAAAAEAVAAVDSFTDIYLGAKASDPSFDNDGNALQVGALYWNTTVGVVKAWTGTAWTAVYDRTVAVGITIDGGGVVLTTGIKQVGIPIPFAGIITAVTLLGDVSGSIVIDIWKDSYANFPPVVGDSITASAKPTISSALKSQDTTLTGWTTAIAAGDILRFNINSVTSIKQVTLALTVLKTPI